MAGTRIVLDRQAVAKVFDFGTTSASGEALVTIRKGTAATSTVVLAVEGSQTIGGSLNVTGDLNVTGQINRTTVTNLDVADLTIRVNNGGTTAGATGAGLEVEGDTDTTIGAIRYASGSATKFTIGDGSTQADIVSTSATQTLTNKSISGGQISSAVALATLASTVTTNANLTGPVTSSGNATTITDSAITYAKIQDVATNTLIGRSAGGSGPVTGITVGSGLQLSGGILSSTAAGGSVTTVSVVSANGVSGSVADASTTPALTITLGAITPTSVNGLTLSALATGFSIAGGTTSKTLTVTDTTSIPGTHSGTSSGSNTGDQTITLTGAVTGSGTGSFATTLGQYFREITVSSGTQNGVNTAFVLTQTPLAGTELITQNGQVLTKGASADYTISGATVTYVNAIPAADDVMVYRGIY